MTLLVVQNDTPEVLLDCGLDMVKDDLNSLVRSIGAIGDQSRETLPSFPRIPPLWHFSNVPGMLS